MIPHPDWNVSTTSLCVLLSYFGGRGTGVIISLNCGTLDRGDILHFRGENESIPNFISFYITQMDKMDNKWITNIWERSPKLLFDLKCRATMHSLMLLFINGPLFSPHILTELWQWLKIFGVLINCQSSIILRAVNNFGFD